MREVQVKAGKYRHPYNFSQSPVARDEVLRVLLTPAERQLIHAYAAKLSLSSSAFVREAALGRIKALAEVEAELDDGPSTERRPISGTER